jgi:hypothetical protein
MSKFEKLKARFLTRPADFTYDELATLLKALGYREEKGGSSSRVACIHEGRKHIIRLHRPHPATVLKRYQMDQVISELKAQEDL